MAREILRRTRLFRLPLFHLLLLLQEDVELAVNLIRSVICSSQQSASNSTKQSAFSSQPPQHQKDKESSSKIKSRKQSSAALSKNSVSGRWDLPAPTFGVQPEPEAPMVASSGFEVGLTSLETCSSDRNRRSARMMSRIFLSRLRALLFLPLSHSLMTSST